MEANGHKLNAEMIRAWLRKEDRKQSYLTRRLGISGSSVMQMLGSSAHVPKEETLKALAKLMGVQVSDLLLPREGKRSA